MTNNWLKNNRYQINLLVPKDWKETLEQKISYDKLRQRDSGWGN